MAENSTAATAKKPAAGLALFAFSFALRTMLFSSPGCRYGFESEKSPNCQVLVAVEADWE
jgi:hypothetical protein